MLSIWKKNHKSDTSLVSYDNGSEKKILNLRISRIRQGSGIMLLAEDVTSTHMLKQHEKDCALIFAGLIICICVYLSAWSLIKFTLGIHLKTSVYTMVIEGIAFLLFLEVIFFTSLTFSDIGIFVRPSKLLKSFISSLPLAAGACIVMVMINVSPLQRAPDKTLFYVVLSRGHTLISLQPFCRNFSHEVSYRLL